MPNPEDEFLHPELYKLAEHAEGTTLQILISPPDMSVSLLFQNIKERFTSSPDYVIYIDCGIVPIEEFPARLMEELQPSDFKKKAAKVSYDVLSNYIKTKSSPVQYLLLENTDFYALDNNANVDSWLNLCQRTLPAIGTTVIAHSILEYDHLLSKAAGRPFVNSSRSNRNQYARMQASVADGYGQWSHAQIKNRLQRFQMRVDQEVITNVTTHAMNRPNVLSSILNEANLLQLSDAAYIKGIADKHHRSNGRLIYERVPTCCQKSLRALVCETGEISFDCLLALVDSGILIRRSEPGQYLNCVPAVEEWGRYWKGAPR